MRTLFVLTAVLAMALIFAPNPAQAQDPPQLQAALADLSARVGTEVTVNNITSYTYESQQFSDTSLGCPQEGQTYAQVVTPGYQFTITYAGQQYDYRVSDDQSIVILCSVSPVDDTAPPADPTRRQMDQPILAVSPLIGTPGTTVQVLANGFPASAQVIVGVGRVDSEYDVVQTLRTDNQGALSADVIVPDYFGAGEDIVFVVETSDNTLRVVSFPFTVSGTGGEVPGNPQVTLSSLSGPPGSALTLTATGFPPNSSVLIGVGPQNAADFVYSLQETTNAQGSMTVEIAIPEDAQVNRPYVALVELEANRDYEAISPVFTPTGPEPTPVPEGDEFTTADIYLIATGDDGQSGIEVGCNDSAIPVQVNFAPTVAPLTAALEQMLAINTQMYGQSGLYNALYQSTLSVEGINIENGVATINLTGTLLLGGVCDGPRAEAQIRLTALQFSTIDAVTILINGQPIENLISGQ